MDHNIIETEEQKDLQALVIYKKDNNLDQRDNLDELSTDPAVYALCGRVNGQPSNPRFIGESDNLQVAIKQHFDPQKEQPTECLKEFMQSIKIKYLLYQSMPGKNEVDRQKIVKEWSDKYQPTCNEEINKVY